MPHTLALSPHPSLPNRCTVLVHQISWDVPFPDYAPATHPTADSQVQQKSELSTLVSYCGDIAMDEKTGMPLNPVGRTGLRGRGVLPNIGPNHSYLFMVTRHHPATNQLEMAFSISKSQLLLPGGIVSTSTSETCTLKNIQDRFTDQVVFAAAQPSAPNSPVVFEPKIRELFEEQLQRNATQIYLGYLDDSRNTDNSWVEADIVHMHCSSPLAKLLTINDTEYGLSLDIPEASLVWRSVERDSDYILSVIPSHAPYVRRTVQAILSERDVLTKTVPGTVRLDVDQKHRICQRLRPAYQNLEVKYPISGLIARELQIVLRFPFSWELVRYVVVAMIRGELKKDQLTVAEDSHVLRILVEAQTPTSLPRVGATALDWYDVVEIQEQPRIITSVSANKSKRDLITIEQRSVWQAQTDRSLSNESTDYCCWLKFGFPITYMDDEISQICDNVRDIILDARAAEVSMLQDMCAGSNEQTTEMEDDSNQPLVTNLPLGEDDDEDYDVWVRRRTLGPVSVSATKIQLGIFSVPAFAVSWPTDPQSAISSISVQWYRWDERSKQKVKIQGANSRILALTADDYAVPLEVEVTPHISGTGAAPPVVANALWKDEAIEHELGFIRSKPEVMFKVRGVRDLRKGTGVSRVTVPQDSSLVMFVSVAGVRVKSGSRSQVVFEECFRDDFKAEINRNPVKLEISWRGSGGCFEVEMSLPLQRNLVVLCLRHFASLSVTRH